ncbi:MAG: phosphoribosylglycinamide formyltransferase [Cyclobacteriaceae bacterium]
MEINIVILASGSGSNAEELIKHFSNSGNIRVSGVLSNKSDAFVLERAKKFQIANESFDRSSFNSETFLEILEKYHADYIVLAGFLWKMPEAIISRFADRIVNIHPSLLPNYGGKGMYGAHVHKAVIANKEKLSGITIHLVNEEYDKGRILFQASCEISTNETPESLAAKIHKLEHAHFPKVVEDYIKEHS